MNATDILDRLDDQGVSVTVNGNRLRAEPASRIPADLIPALRQNKEHGPDYGTVYVS